MDNITHTFVGLTLSRTPLERAGRGTTAALLIASNIPDLDIVMSIGGGRAAYLADHRAFTHSVFGIVVLGLVTAGLVRLAQRWPRRREASREGPPPASMAALIGVSIVGTLGHVLLDLATPYGTRLLSPVSGVWYSTDWMPIIDIYFLAILVGGAAAFLLRPDRRRWIAATTLALGLGYYGLRAGARVAALHEAGADLAASGLAACTPAADPSRAGWLDLVHWSDPSADVRTAPAGWAARSCVLETAAIPTFLSPFVWRVIERYPDAYEVRDIDVRPAWLAGGDAGASIQQVRFPDSHARAVAEAAGAFPARVFLRFARFPLAHVEHDGADTVVSWSDVRFLGGLTRLTPAQSRASAFRVTVALDSRGHVLSARFGR